MYRACKSLLGISILLVLTSIPAHADILTFNSGSTAENAAVRAAWLNAIGIAAPMHLVTFESGFTNLQNVSGVPGLFPAGLIITDTSNANEAIIRTGAGVINGSDPVGTFSLTHNEAPFLKLDFSASPVDYVGFLDIDQAGTTGVVMFEGGGTANISYETTEAVGFSAEFFGIFRNDRPRITMVLLDASGDGRWGMDNIEYGVLQQQPIPEPTTLLLLGTGLAGIGAFVRRRRTASENKKV